MKIMNPSVAFYILFRKLPTPIQNMIITLYTRMQDPNPEELHTIAPKTAKSGTLVWGWFPILTFTSALGTLLVAYADITSRYVKTDVSIFFWLGLLLVFMPPMARLISPTASRFERISLLCVVGICLYLLKVMYNPLNFFTYDEFLHWRTAQDLARSGHLFAVNALLAVSPDYPGLEIVTNELSSLSGLNIFYAGVTVVGAARIVMILSLFMLNEQIMKSARMAAIATMIYMCNEHFIFFDAQFAYESLALPLATFMMFALIDHETLYINGRWLTLIAWIILVAVVVTHHMTDFIFDGFLILWALISITPSLHFSLRRLKERIAGGKNVSKKRKDRDVSLRTAPIPQPSLVLTALVGVVLSVAYVVLIAHSVTEYISSFLTAAFNELAQVLLGSSKARQLFVDYGGDPTPLWQRAISLSSIGLITVSLPFGLYCLWQRYRSNALACTFGIVSLFYPLTPVFHLTNSGSDITARTATFLFIPLSCILAIFLTQFWLARLLRWKQTTLITCAITVVFLGGLIIGAGPPWSLLPGGPYFVSADAHSIEPQGVQTAIWARSYLGPDNRIATDRTNQILMSTYGDERIVPGQLDNIDMSPIFFSSHLGPNELAILKRAKVRYLVVDLRMAFAYPKFGFYFGPYEPDAFHHIAPIDLEALTKFSTIPQINRVYDSGDIVIYDIGGLINAP